MSAFTSIYVRRLRHSMTLRNRNRYAIRRGEGRIAERIHIASIGLIGRRVHLVRNGETQFSPEERTIIARENFIGQVIGVHTESNEMYVRFGDGIPQNWRQNAFVWLYTSQLELLPLPP